MTPRLSDRARAFMADLAELQALQAEYAGRINMDIQVRGTYSEIVVWAHRQAWDGSDWHDCESQPDPEYICLRYPQDGWLELTQLHRGQMDRLRAFCRHAHPQGSRSWQRNQLLQ